MKRAFLTMVAAVLVAGLSGCATDRTYQVQHGGPGLVRGSCKRAPEICRSCRPSRRAQPVAESFDPGPPAGAVAYPYYTLRGPRDFFASNPPSIGP